MVEDKRLRSIGQAWRGMEETPIRPIQFFLIIPVSLNREYLRLLGIGGDLISSICPAAYVANFVQCDTLMNQAFGLLACMRRLRRKPSLIDPKKVGMAG